MIMKFKNFCFLSGTIIFLSSIIIILARLGYCSSPFMNFEGVGGGGIVAGAYLVNPPKDGELMGKPAFSHWSLIGINQKDDSIYTNGFAFSFLERFEFGYVLETMDFRRLKRQLKKASGGKVDVERPNKNIDRGLSKVGYDGDFGVDFDFSFSKTIKRVFWYPVIINGVIVKSGVWHLRRPPAELFL